MCEHVIQLSIIICYSDTSVDVDQVKYKRRNKKEITCFYCNKKGHFLREFFKKKKDEERLKQVSSIEVDDDQTKSLLDWLRKHEQNCSGEMDGKTLVSKKNRIKTFQRIL